MAILPTRLIADYEAGTVALRPTDLDAIRGSLEGSGVEFIDGERPA
jgi:hypothetical protein